jgi:hypothetical protein
MRKKETLKKCDRCGKKIIDKLSAKNMYICWYEYDCEDGYCDEPLLCGECVDKFNELWDTVLNG